MSWRILQIIQPCRLMVKHQQLCYQPLEGEGLQLPLEDISVIILENKEISLSNALLELVATHGIVLFSCDLTHMPAGVFMPFLDHCRYMETAWQQIESSEPFRKRLWQEVVKAKINNQARMLRLFNLTGWQKMMEIAKLVQSGDAKNYEAFAANIYWKNLFTGFARGNEQDIRNSALDYGYAIVRGCVARSVVGAGLLPCFGIHHANRLNQFNLVDDLMEPFRPYVDYGVHNLDLQNVYELNPKIKHELVRVLTQNCQVGEEEITLLKACEVTALSLTKAFKTKTVKSLKLPVFNNLPLLE